MTLLDLVVLFGYPVVLFVVGFAIERRLGGREPFVSVPVWVRALVGGVALGGPWLLYYRGFLRGLVVPHETFVPLTLAVVLWLAAERLVGVTARQRGAC
jgi:hypothetical protein